MNDMCACNQLAPPMDFLGTIRKCQHLLNCNPYLFVYFERLFQV